MDSAALRTKLHDYIEHADDRHLEAMYVMIESDIEPAYKYDADTIAYFYQLRDKHLKGESKSYSVQEFSELILNRKK